MFKPGQSGNPAGRPKGSRNKLEEDFLKALHADWQAHGVGALQRVREDDPSTYIRAIVQVLPKESKVDVEHKLAETLSEEHARTVAEGFLESLRGHPSLRTEELGSVHGDISSGLPGGGIAPQDCEGAGAG